MNENMENIVVEEVTETETPAYYAEPVMETETDDGDTKMAKLLLIAAGAGAAAAVYEGGKLVKWGYRKAKSGIGKLKEKRAEKKKVKATEEAVDVEFTEVNETEKD